MNSSSALFWVPCEKLNIAIDIKNNDDYVPFDGLLII